MTDIKVRNKGGQPPGEDHPRAARCGNPYNAVAVEIHEECAY